MIWKEIKTAIRKIMTWVVKWAIYFIIFFGLLTPILFWYFRYKELPEMSSIQNHNIVYGVNVIDEYTLWYYTSLVTITVGLALIAWIQLKNLLSRLRADYLLEIDNRWHSKEIIKARIVIHALYLQSKKYIADNKLPPETLKCRLRKKIITLSDSQNKLQLRNFIYLLNFIDFMESIGYFYSKKYLSKKQVEELFGISYKFNFEIFKPYVEHRRLTHNNNELYKEFENLYHELCKTK